MKRKTKDKKRETAKKVLLLVGAVIACIALIFWTREPAFFGIRYSLPYSIAVLVAVSAALCLFAFHPFFAQPVYGKVLLAAGAVLVWFTLFLSDRAKCLLLFVYGTLSLAVDAFFFLYEMRKEKHDERYVPKGIPRLTQVLTAACLCALSVICVFFLKDLLRKKSERVLVPVLTLTFSFLFVWVALGVFNYSLDTGTPQQIVADVYDMRVSSGGRGPTVYELTLQTREGEEITLNVGQRVWHEVKEGDRITVSLYEGALGEPYYIYEE